MRGIHRGPVNSSHKWPVTQKMFPFDDVILSSFQVPLFVVLVCLFMMLLIIGVSLYTDPVLMGGGLILFLLGIPLYYLKQYLVGNGALQGTGKMVQYALGDHHRYLTEYSINLMGITYTWCSYWYRYWNSNHWISTVRCLSRLSIHIITVTS